MKKTKSKASVWPAIYLVTGMLVLSLIISWVNPSLSFNPTGRAVDFTKVDPASLEGMWKFTENMDAKKCGASVDIWDYETQISKSGEHTFTFSFPAAELPESRASRGIFSITSELINNKAILKGSAPLRPYGDPSGTLNINYGELVFSDDCNSLKGYLNMTLIDPDSCDIDSLIEAVKTTNLGCTFICEEYWQCGEWGECVDGEQTRACTDANSCGTSKEKSDEMRGCTIIVKESAPIEEPAPEKGIDYNLIGKIIAGIAVIGLAAYFFISKRSGKKVKKKR